MSNLLASVCLLALVIFTSDWLDALEVCVCCGILKSNSTGEGLGMFLGGLEKRYLRVWVIVLTRIIIIFVVVKNNNDKLNAN